MQFQPVLDRAACRPEAFKIRPAPGLRKVSQERPFLDDGSVLSVRDFFGLRKSGKQVVALERLFCTCLLRPWNYMLCSRPHSLNTDFVPKPVFALDKACAI